MTSPGKGWKAVIRIVNFIVLTVTREEWCCESGCFCDDVTLILTKTFSLSEMECAMDDIFSFSFLFFLFHSF